MKTRHLVAALTAQVALGLPVAFAAAAQSRAEVTPPAKRQAAVDIAQRLTQPPTPQPIPEKLNHPFNPASFAEQEAEAARAAKAPGAPANATKAVAPPADREVLETLAQRIPSTGTLTTSAGEPLLVVGRNRLKVGDVFTVTYNNLDYDLELIAIDRTTFSLRYRNEETTRPIKSK